MKNVILADFKKHAVINAARLTDDQVADIKSQGLIIKHRPDNLVLAEAEQAMQRQQSCISAEAWVA